MTGGWLDSNQWEWVTRHYPDEVTFKQYSAHPEYRVIGDHVYDTNGNLVYTNRSLQYIEDSYLDTSEMTKRIKTGFMKALCLRDFEKNKYGIRTPSNANHIKDLISRLLPEGFPNFEVPNARREEKEYRYVKQLVDDNTAAINASVVMDTTRLGNNTIRYSIGYNDTIRFQTTFSFSGNGRYKVKVTMQSRLVNIPIVKSEVKPTIKEVAEVTESDDNASIVFDVVEQMPSFEGGTDNLIQWIAQHLQYPAVAAENGVGGNVVVGFIIDKEGNVQSPTVIRSVDPSLDRAALRLIKSMPKWNPGKQNGHTVNVRYSVPVTFRLE